jgi:hypothetical protein
MTDACLACHAPISAQIEAGKGIHGRLGAQRASQCAMCHSEHHGEDFQLVNSMSFAQAGAGDPDTFDHSLVGFDMAGRHLDLACAKCHPLADVHVLPAGERRFMGLTQACATCHQDAHQGRMQLSCATCHGQDSFRDLVAVDHDKVLPLIGGHADLSCVTCHGKDTDHSLDAVGARTTHVVRTCTDCHSSPHQPEFAALAAQATGTSSPKACATCHAPAHDTFTAAAELMTPAQHAFSGFTLAAPHDQATCAQCHGPAGAGFAARHPGRAPHDCRACHEDPHGGQFDHAPIAVAGCVGCHATTHFTPHEFTPDKHARTALPLVGSHLDADCNRCHLQPSVTEARVFHGVTAQCDGCHADAHDDFFKRALAQRADVEHGACAHCHEPTKFAQPRPGFDHGAWTGFALRGSHAEAACESCHVRAAEPDAHGRRFGRVADTFLPTTGCVRCHEDPHGGTFDQAGRPAQVDGHASCARCHGEASFRELPRAFDHGQWTGLPLTGSHAGVKCSACHAPLSRADAHGRSFARAKGSACADCHQDPHGGQFAAQGRIDCARCHQPTHFKSLVFNHNLDARFRLGAAHEKVACSKCHRPERIGEREVARYRPLAHQCVDCHGQHEDQLRIRKRRGP